MSAPGTFCVVSVDGTTAEGSYRVLDKSRFVQRVGVNSHLHIVFFSHTQTAVDGSWRCAPVLVQLQPQSTRLDLFTQRLWHRAITFTQEAEINGIFISRLQHTVQVPGARGAGGRFGPRGRTSPTPNECGDSGRQRLRDLLWADEMDMAVNTAGRHNQPFTGNHFRARSDNQ